MAYNEYDLGDVVILKATFAVDGTPASPATVTFGVKPPDSPQVIYAHGTDDEITNPDDGEYQCQITIDEVGLWRYKVWSTGQGAGAQEAALIVRSTIFAS